MSSSQSTLRVTFGTKLTLNEELWGREREVDWKSDWDIRTDPINISATQNELIDATLPEFGGYVQSGMKSESYRKAKGYAINNRSQLFNVINTMMKSAFEECKTQGGFAVSGMTFDWDSTDRFTDERLDRRTDAIPELIVKMHPERVFSDGAAFLSIVKEYFTGDGKTKTSPTTAQREIVDKAVTSFAEYFNYYKSNRPAAAEAAADPEVDTEGLKAPLRAAAQRALHEWEKDDLCRMVANVDGIELRWASWRPSSTNSRKGHNPPSGYDLPRAILERDDEVTQ